LPHALPARDASLQEVSVIFRRLFSATLLLAALAAAIPAAAQTRYPLTVTDDAGTTLTLPSAPGRIISLTISTDEMLLSLVARNRLLGVTAFAVDRELSNVADAAASVPNKLTLNVETVISLRPDLVLVARWTDPGLVQQLRDARVPVYLMTNGLTVPEIEAKIMRLALVVDEPRKGREMVAGMESRLAAVARAVSAVAPGKRLRVMDYATWGSAQGKGSSWDEIVQRAGLINAVAGSAADSWGQVPLSREKILKTDPDILILPGWVYGNPKGAAAFSARITTDPAFRALAAVRTGRVYSMPENLKSSTSQFIAAAVEWLARTAYPAFFS
jgi:iron complex transport system substrate-binding protein